MPSGAFDEEEDSKKQRSMAQGSVCSASGIAGQATEFEGCLIVWGLDEVEHQRKEGRIEWRERE